MDFQAVSVFTDGNPFRGGNQLAVFPDAAAFSRDQMQAIAATMNYSESTFVTEASDQSYAMRIFTPKEELPFAGHPTIGTAWVLRLLGLVSGDELIQNSAAGPTAIRTEGSRVWFERTGEASRDRADGEPRFHSQLAHALRVDVDEIGLVWTDEPGSRLLCPAYSNAGIEQLMVPLRDVDAVARCNPRAQELGEIAGWGAYCFTATEPGRFHARGLFPGAGVDEDPATGSAAAALGLYLADRIGDVDFEIEQGIEMGRPCRIFIRAARGTVLVGGSCGPVFRGTLSGLP